MNSAPDAIGGRRRVALMVILFFTGVWRWRRLPWARELAIVAVIVLAAPQPGSRPAS